MTGDRLRTPWRLLLFGALFVALLWLEVVLFPFIAAMELPEDRLSPGLVAQSGLMLMAALLAAWVMLRWVDRRPVRGLGFPLKVSGLRELGLGLVIGTVALAAVVALGSLAGWYGYTAEPGSALGWVRTSGVALMALVIPAAWEEALLRGYPFRALREGAGATVAVVVTSAVFAAMHGGNPGTSVLAFANLFLAGVLLAVAVLRTGTLWLATGVHLGWNWIMSGPLDLPVSGLQGLDVPLYDAVVTGPAWVTGGGFGPEGGVVGTLGACLGLVLVLWTTRPGGIRTGAER